MKYIVKIESTDESVKKTVKTVEGLEEGITCYADILVNLGKVERVAVDGKEVSKFWVSLWSCEDDDLDHFIAIEYFDKESTPWDIEEL